MIAYQQSDQSDVKVMSPANVRASARFMAIIDDLNEVVPLFGAEREQSPSHRRCASGRARGLGAWRRVDEKDLDLGHDLAPAS